MEHPDAAYADAIITNPTHQIQPGTNPVAHVKVHQPPDHLIARSQTTTQAGETYDNNGITNIAKWRLWMAQLLRMAAFFFGIFAAPQCANANATDHGADNDPGCHWEFFNALFVLLMITAIAIGFVPILITTCQGNKCLPRCCVCCLKAPASGGICCSSHWWVKIMFIKAEFIAFLAFFSGTVIYATLVHRPRYRNEDFYVPIVDATANIYSFYCLFRQAGPDYRQLASDHKSGMIGKTGVCTFDGQWCPCIWCWCGSSTICGYEVSPHKLRVNGEPINAYRARCSHLVCISICIGFIIVHVMKRKSRGATSDIVLELTFAMLCVVGILVIEKVADCYNQRLKSQSLPDTVDSKFGHDDAGDWRVSDLKTKLIVA